MYGYMYMYMIRIIHIPFNLQCKKRTPLGTNTMKQRKYRKTWTLDHEHQEIGQYARTT